MNSKKIVFIAGIPIIALVTVLYVVSFDSFSNTKDVHSTRAVIIDQLYSDVPSAYFHTKSREYLTNMGYTVDLYTTENATVDLFRKLPSMNYDFIVFRGHALSSDTEKNRPVMFFTGEKYSEDKYIQEQLFGQIKKGTPLLERTFSIDENTSTGWIPVNGSNNTKMITSKVNFSDQIRDEYFLFTPRSVNDLMQGRFSSSTILLGGCSTLNNTSMAKALIDKGASKVVGWTDLISSSENDQTLLQILEKMSDEKLSISNATTQVKDSLSISSKHNTKLEIFG